MKFLHYLDNNHGGTKWVEAEYLTLSVFDLTILRGVGVFDFLRTYNKKPFMLKEHIDRLFNSAKLLHLKLTWGKKDITDLVYEGLRKNTKNADDFNVRILITGGVGPDSLTLGNSSLILIFSEVTVYPQKYYTQGIRVITHAGKRIITNAKSIDYLEGILVLQKAKTKKAVEGIYIDKQEKMYEGVTSNIFVVKNNILITPKNDILYGITRQVVLNIAKNLGIHVLEKDIFLRDIAAFQEAFITASNKEVMPVVYIDTKKVGDGKVGKTTQAIIEKFRFLTNQKKGGYLPYGILTVCLSYTLNSFLFSFHT